MPTGPGRLCRKCSIHRWVRMPSSDASVPKAVLVSPRVTRIDCVTPFRLMPLAIDTVPMETALPNVSTFVVETNEVPVPFQVTAAPCHRS